MAVSKRLRFEIFRRDNHACRYCGAAAPDAKLTIDHVVPTALGGSDEPSNLVTACADCNSGKTSASPDSTIVADVTADTIRWAHAMKAAVNAAMADRDAIAAQLEEFQEGWDSWTYGPRDDPRPVPKPANWEGSVRSFLAAGLPMPLLLDAVKTAMGKRKVKPEDTFRYMCGVAWSMLRDIRNRAQGQMAERSQAGQSDADFELANQILSFLGAHEVDQLLAADRDLYEGLDDDASYGTPEERVALDAFCRERIERDHAIDSLNRLLTLHPNVQIGRWADEARHRLMDADPGIEPRPGRVLAEAVDAFVREQAEELLGALPVEQRAEWEALTRVLHGPDDWVDGGSRADGDLAVHTAHAVRLHTAGRYYTHMCFGHGEHIGACPRVAEFYVRVRECHRCWPTLVPGHHHGVCPDHLEALIDGTWAGREGGRPVTVLDYTTVGAGA